MFVHEVDPLRPWHPAAPAPAPDRTTHMQRMVLALQTAAGNKAVRRLVQPARSSPPDQPVQRCGATSHAGCPCVAEQPPVAGTAATGPVLGRQAESADPKPKLSPQEQDAMKASLCIGDELQTGPATRQFTGREQQTVSATLWAARSLASSGVQALSRHDPYIVSVARRILHEPAMDPDEIATTARNIHQALDTPVVCGTCANSVCNPGGGHSALADAADDHSLVTICPFFFHPGIPVVEQRRTWLHEAGHIAGIDDPPPGTPYQHPPYCPQDTGGNCQDPCPSGDKNNVDNWARLLECVDSL